MMSDEHNDPITDEKEVEELLKDDYHKPRELGDEEVNTEEMK